MKKISALFFAFVFVFSVTSVLASNSANNRNQNSARLRICQTREATIKNRTERIMNMASAMIDNFEIKSQKVQVFYSKNVIPKGKTVSNYGNLVADVQTKKNVVLVELSKARAEAESFSCTGNEPQKSMQDFRKYMLEVNTALKNYRTSVKNLIVAVRTAANAGIKS